jgi:hypothetical protein
LSVKIKVDASHQTKDINRVKNKAVEVSKFLEQSKEKIDNILSIFNKSVAISETNEEELVELTLDDESNEESLLSEDDLEKALKSYNDGRSKEEELFSELEKLLQSDGEQPLVEKNNKKENKTKQYSEKEIEEVVLKIVEENLPTKGGGGSGRLSFAKPTYSNTGSGTEIYNLTNNNFKTIVAGTNVSITSTDSEVTINSLGISGSLSIQTLLSSSVMEEILTGEANGVNRGDADHRRQHLPTTSV